MNRLSAHIVFAVFSLLSPAIFLILFSFSFTHILQQSPYSLLTFSLNFYHHHNRLFCLSWRSSLLLLFQFACDNLSSQTVSVCGSATVRERIARKRERARVVCVNVWVLSLLAVLSGQFSIAVRHSSRPSASERRTPLDLGTDQSALAPSSGLVASATTTNTVAVLVERLHFFSFILFLIFSNLSISIFSLTLFVNLPDSYFLSFSLIHSFSARPPLERSAVCASSSFSSSSSHLRVPQKALSDLATRSVATKLRP